MKKTILVAIGCLAVLIAGFIASNLDKFSVQAEAEACCNKSRSRVYDVPPANFTVPEITQAEYVPYMFLFQHLSNIKDKKYQLEELRGKSGLSGEEFGKVIQAAARYNKEVSIYDAEAKAIIDEIHRQYPPGNLPEGTGPPQPPAELDELQNKRDSAALKYRDELMTELDSQKFEAFVAREFKGKIRQQPVGKSLYPTVQQSEGQ